MSDQVPSYPRGQVAYGGGDLQQCFNAKLTVANGAKTRATLRKKFSGITLGEETVSMTFDTRIDESGPERDWFKLVQKGTPGQARFKFPGGITKTINCVASQCDSDFSIEEGVNSTVTLVGGLVED